MADIDKALPNTKSTVEVPGEVEIEEAIKEKVEEVETKGGVFSDQATQYNPDITLGSDFMKQTRKPLSEEKFYEQFYGVPYDPYKGKYFVPTGKSDPNYYRITQADTYGKFKNLVDTGIIDFYTGPTDYKTYLKNFADGGSVDLTIITMPDISGSGVESLFKRR